MDTIGLSNYANDALNKSMFTNALRYPTAEEADAVIEENFKKGTLDEELYKQAREILDKGKAQEEEGISE